MALLASTVDYPSPAKDCWLKSRNVAILAKYSPFVVCLASGQLEKEAIRQHIAQDSHFLREFEQACLKADEYAADDDARDAISKFRRAVLDELKLRKFFVQEWGIDPSKEVASNPVTIKYTNFLSATSNGRIVGKAADFIATPFDKTRIPAYTVGAMIPCMRLYAFLGKELEPFLRLYDSDNPCTDWIKNYSPSTSEFEEAAVQIENLLDKLSVSLTGEELELTQKLYHHAMKLAIELFFAQPISQPCVVPLSRLHDSKNRFFIFSDFDLTCTEVDSSSILAEITILNAPRCADPPKADNSDNQISSSENPVKQTSAEVKEVWVAISKEYTEEYQKCIESLLPTEEAKTFDLEYLYKSLEQLSDFEKWANSRVIQLGVLRGVNMDIIKHAGKHLILQDGCAEFFEKVVAQKERLNADFHILSYCWCGDFVRSAFSSGCLDDLTIHSNELVFEESVTTGEIVRKIETPLDKVQTFTSILDQSSEMGHFSVYIGDTIADLLCLLEANVGIVVGSSDTLRKVGKQFGISFLPLSEILVDKQRELESRGFSVWKEKSGVLYTVSGWSEIHAFILGY